MVYNEYALLGALLGNSKDAPEIYKTISDEAFTDKRCSIIYKIMRDMYFSGERIDIITVADQIDTKKGKSAFLESINSYAFVNELINGCPLIANALLYAGNVEVAYVKRRVVESAGIIQKLAKDGDYENVLDLKNDAIKVISDIPISNERGVGSSFSDVIEVCVVDIIKKRNLTQEEEERLYTGFELFDRITDGFHRQELTIVGARPAIGKTQFALAIAKKLAVRKNKILFFSREMGDKTLGNRFLSNLTGIEGHRLRRARCLTEDEVGLIIETNKNIKKLQQLNVTFNTSAATIQEIRSVVRELSLRNEVDVVMIDYLALLQSIGHRGDRRSEIEYISRQLKMMTLDYNVPIICLSQLNRSSSRENREPELHDLRESGQIEADADNVIFLHIPQWVKDTNIAFPMKIIIAKQRNGATADVWLWNDRNKMDLYDPTEDELEKFNSMDKDGGGTFI